MNVVRFHHERLLTLFQEEKVVTMPQLKAALGTTVDGTVFRKLCTLPYRSSYSHRGAYYTLDSLAQFDARGLWSHQGICFSRQGTLLETTNLASGVWTTNSATSPFTNMPATNEPVKFFRVRCP